MIQSKETVSIIMPLFNSEHFLGESITSVLSQTYENWQLIIVDDVSTDNSYQIAKRYAKEDQRINLYKMAAKSKNGALDVRNECLSHVKGRYIAFLDSDDLWSPTFIEEQLKFLQENNTGFVCSAFNRMTPTKSVPYFPPKIATYKDILKTDSIGCLTAFYDTHIIGKVVLMPKNSYKREDWACFLQVIKLNNGVIYGNQKVLATYRIHGSSVSSKKIKMVKYQFNVYRNVEKLGIFKSFYYLCCWAIAGIKKYHRLKK